MVHVALLEGADRRKTVRKAVDDLGQQLWRACREAEYLFVKVNLENCDMEAVRGTLDVLRLYANGPIVLGDAPMYGAKEIFRSDAWYALSREYPNLHLLDLTVDDVIENVFVRDDGSELILRRAKTAVEAPLSLVVDQGPSVSSWAHGTWIVPPRETARGKAWNRAPWIEALTLSEQERLITELFSVHSCHGAVLSGMLGGSGVIASMDPVAADTLLIAMTGSDAHQVPHLESLGQDPRWTNEISEIDIPLITLSNLL